MLIGDVVGKAGRRAVQEHLGAIVKARGGVDLVIANGENSAAGLGITPKIASELFRVGVDVITTGNHVWRRQEVFGFLDTDQRILRPQNYPPGAPGRGLLVMETASGARVAVLNLLGRVFMDPMDCPFRAADAVLEGMTLGRDVNAIIVDFHAEATSEKVAMGHYLDGRVSAVLGTHTHVPTADHRILPGGTGFQCDVGMVGDFDSVIGMGVETVLPRFLTGLPTRFEPAEGPATLCATLVRVDARSGRCRGVEPLRGGATLDSGIGER
ncbi:MAG: TIGR00282 family metallophosphoesterase [Magnetococcales bacterium]|nr:TIGR00282 family metallophosphoesterase [Magnetococcales bacterium]